MGEAKRERERERVAGKRLVDAGTRGTREREREERRRVGAKTIVSS